MHGKGGGVYGSSVSLLGAGGIAQTYLCRGYYFWDGLLGLEGALMAAVCLWWEPALGSHSTYLLYSKEVTLGCISLSQVCPYLLQEEIRGTSHLEMEHAHLNAPAQPAALLRE